MLGVQFSSSRRQFRTEQLLATGSRYQRGLHPEGYTSAHGRDLNTRSSSCLSLLYCTDTTYCKPTPKFQRNPPASGMIVVNHQLSHTLRRYDGKIPLHSVEYQSLTLPSQMAFPGPIAIKTLLVTCTPTLQKCGTNATNARSALCSVRHTDFRQGVLFIIVLELVDHSRYHLDYGVIYVLCTAVTYLQSTL